MDVMSSYGYGPWGFGGGFGGFGPYGGGFPPMGWPPGFGGPGFGGPSNFFGQQVRRVENQAMNRLIDEWDTLDRNNDHALNSSELDAVDWEEQEQLAVVQELRTNMGLYMFADQNEPGNEHWNGISQRDLYVLTQNPQTLQENIPVLQWKIRFQHPELLSAGPLRFNDVISQESQRFGSDIFA